MCRARCGIRTVNWGALYWSRDWCQRKFPWRHSDDISLGIRNGCLLSCDMHGREHNLLWLAFRVRLLQDAETHAHAYAAYGSSSS